jgi:hypothetical protein
MDWKEKTYTIAFKLLRSYFETYLQNKNVVGLGVGYKNDTKQLCIHFLVEKKEEVDEKDRIPSRILFFKTDVREVGCIDLAAGIRIPDTRRHHPLTGGTEITPDKLSVGTLGLIVPCWKTRAGHPLTGNKIKALRTIQSDDGLTMKEMGFHKSAVGITNTHVLGNYKPFFGNFVFHPMRTGIIVGTVAEGFDLRDAGFRRWDFALVNLSLKPNDYLTMHIDQIGVINQKVVTPRVGERVKTKGRTSGYWEANVVTTNSTLAINYNHGTIVMRDCVVTDKGIARGNSGSMFVTMDNNIHSLVYAGSPTVGVSHNLEWMPSWLGWDLQ